MMSEVELSELSRCSIGYLAQSTAWVVTGVPLPPPSSVEPQAQVGPNLGSDNNPTSRSPRPLTRFLLPPLDAWTALNQLLSAHRP